MLQEVADLACKTTENCHFSLLATTTDLQCQEQTLHLISQRLCEMKFQHCLLTTVKINHFPPGSILLPQFPSRPSVSPALKHLLHPFHLPQKNEAVSNEKGLHLGLLPQQQCAALQSLFAKQQWAHSLRAMPCRLQSP